MLLTAAFFAAQIFAATPQGPVQVTLKDAKNETVGTATITPMAKGVKIALDVTKLPPGDHAVHIHEKGDCAGPKFDSAGGHFAPTNKGHGFDSNEGPHAGDMANFHVGADGTAKVEIVNTAVTLVAGPTSIMKTGGTALVVHEKADDYKSQPAGNAGGRIACGAIK